MNINDLLAKTGATANILEEEIDVDTQRQYIALAKRLCKRKQEYEVLLQQARENPDRLFDETVSDEEKKQLLVLLATLNDVAIYRTIESFAKQQTCLQKWAAVALQQARVLLQSTFLEENTVFVSTGLGGSGYNLRYFCVFFINTDTGLQPYQRNVIQNETEMALGRLKGSVERFEFYDRYITLTALLPIQADLKEVFKSIIEECNMYGHFLHEQMIITNVRKLTIEEIDTFLDDEYSGEER
jgi:hypothetical protein